MPEKTLFELMANELLSDYSALFYVDAATNDYKWYAKDEKTGRHKLMSEGSGFYDYVKNEAVKLVCDEDKVLILDYLEPESLKKTLAPGQTTDIKFRYTGGNDLQFYTMHIVRSAEGYGDDHFVIGLENVSEEERRRRVVQQIKEEREIYNQIAMSLAEEYNSIYYIDIETGKYMEFAPREYFYSMNTPKTWDDFYHYAQEDAKIYVHPDDRDFAISMYDKETIKEKLREKKSVNFKYRLMRNGVPRYHLFTLIRANEGKNFVLCVKDIENELAAERVRKEKIKKEISFTQIAESLASNYDIIYYVDIENSNYVGYTSRNILGHMEVQEQGLDFYHDISGNIPKLIHPDDIERLLGVLTNDNLRSTLDMRRVTEIDYRMIVNDEVKYTRLTARKSSDGRHFILGIENIDEMVKKERSQLTALNAEREIARRDGLTGVKNKYAYDELIKSVQANITSGLDYLPFAIAVCDLNYLKQTNDTLGHQAGDELLKAACKLICYTFDHSPVFRIGGDEFAVFIRGDDYDNRAKLEGSFKEQVLKNDESGDGPVVAIGVAVFEQGIDLSVEDVFERADELMYVNKKELKEK